MPDEKIHPRYAHEHFMEEHIIPVVLFLTKCLGNSSSITERYKYDTCVRLLHHFGRWGSWGAGDITTIKLNLYGERSTTSDKQVIADVEEAIRYVETVEQMLSGQ